MHTEALRRATIIPSGPPGDPVDTQADADAPPLTAQAWAIGGMHCAACAQTLAALLRGQAGVVQADVGYGAALAVVRAPQAVQAQLPGLARRGGYVLVPAEPESAAALRRQEARSLLWRVFVAGFCMMQIMMLAAPTYFAEGAGVPPDLRQLLHWGSWVLAWPVMLFSAQPYLVGAWRSLRQSRLGMDVPVALGILITFGVSSLALFNPAGPWGAEVYFDSLSMFVAFLLLGRWYELKARHAAAAELLALQNQTAEPARRETLAGGLEAVDAAALLPGEVVHVALGERFAVDGTLIEGRTQADEAVLSGESAPVPKLAGAAILGGSLNLGAPVRVRVSRSLADSQVQQLAQRLQQALTERPRTDGDAERWATPFLAGVLLLALTAGVAWSFIDASRALMVACTVLIVTCPCALALAAPAARAASARALARRGVVLQRLDALDSLARIDHVVLDKTGTLTRPEVRVRQLTTAAGLPSLHAAARALAAQSVHPLAQAVARVPLPPGAVPWRWQQAEEVAGAGLRARDPVGDWWRLGSAAWVGSGQNPALDADHAAVLFSREGQSPLLAFEAYEAPLPQARQAVQALRDGGVHLALLSGDQAHRVKAMAAQLGIEQAAAACTPEGKLQAVRALQQAGNRVLMVGDGVNDAPVLAQADAAVAVGGASALASRAADAVLTRADLLALPELLALARKTRRVARQNLVWAASYNLLAIPLALAGWLPPWAAGLGMALSSALVVANALRLAR